MKFFYMILRDLLIVLFVLALIGCGSKPAKIAKTETLPEVILAAGDVLDIKFFYTPELNETQTVRPDGKIALQLVGEIDVHGKTPAELRYNLVELYTPHLKNISLENPEITVIVRSLRSNRVYVGGEVITPGFIEMSGRLTALEAVMEAGGFNLETAKLQNVVIIRHKNGKRSGYKLNLKKSLSGKEVEPFILGPYDIVFVPRTKIANVSQWIDNYVNSMIPQAILLSIPYYVYGLVVD